MAEKHTALATKLIHGSDALRPHHNGAVNLPIYQSSVFEADSYDSVRYIRFNNTPNHLELHRKIAMIEEAESAVVGASGGGKSTLMQMVLRFFDPETGRILIDGQDIRQVTLHSPLPPQLWSLTSVRNQ